MSYFVYLYFRKSSNRNSPLYVNSTNKCWKRSLWSWQPCFLGYYYKKIFYIYLEIFLKPHIQIHFFLNTQLLLCLNSWNFLIFFKSHLKKLIVLRQFPFYTAGFLPAILLCNFVIWGDMININMYFLFILFRKVY